MQHQTSTIGVWSDSSIKQVASTNAHCRFGTLFNSNGCDCGELMVVNQVLVQAQGWLPALDDHNNIHDTSTRANSCDDNPPIAVQCLFKLITDAQVGFIWKVWAIKLNLNEYLHRLSIARRELLSNVLRVSCAASLDRDDCRAEINCQNRHDLARRVAASATRACWAAAQR